MPERRAEQLLHVLLYVIVVLAIIGVILVFIHSTSTGLAVFEVIAFSVGVSALTLAVLGSITSLRQLRIMQKLSREMHAALAEIREVNLDGEAIKETLARDYETTQSIVKALHSSGVGESDAARQTIATTIRESLHKQTKR